MVGAVILAAGQARRFGRPKVLEKVLGRPILFYAVRPFHGLVDKVVVVVPSGCEDEYGSAAGDVDAVVVGGATRGESAAAGIAALHKCDIILVHDAARPAVPTSDIIRLLEAIKKDHSAALVYPVTDTIKRVEKGYIVKTIQRRGLYRALTPQGFIRKSYEKALEKVGEFGPDEAWLFEKAGSPPVAVFAEGYNPKLTYEKELRFVEAFLEG